VDLRNQQRSDSCKFVGWQASTPRQDLAMKWSRIGKEQQVQYKSNSNLKVTAVILLMTGK